MVWIVMTVLILCIILVLLSSISITLQCQITHKCIEIVCNARLYRMRVFRKIYVHHFGEEDEANSEHVRQVDVGQIMKSLPKFLRKWIRILNKFHIQSLDWQTRIGAGEASSTAVIIGGLWTIKGTFISLLDHYSKSCTQPSLHITPHFNSFHLETDFVCIGSIRVGHAIISIFNA